MHTNGFKIATQTCSDPPAVHPADERYFKPTQGGGSQAVPTPELSDPGGGGSGGP